MPVVEVTWNPRTEIWTSDRPFAYPFWARNCGPEPLRLSGYESQWSPDDGRTWPLRAPHECEVVLEPGHCRRLGFSAFPPWECGRWRVRPQLHLGGPWTQDGPRPFGTVVVGPHPKRPTFLSRSLAPEDLALGEAVKQWLLSYNLIPDTVGAPAPVPDHRVVPEVGSRVQRADALVALATPRYLDEHHVRHPSEWIPAETLNAAAGRKPILILRTGVTELTGPLGLLIKTQGAMVLDVPPSGDLAAWSQGAEVVWTIRALRWLAERHVGWSFWHGLAQNLPALAVGAALGQALLSESQKPAR